MSGVCVILALLAQPAAPFEPRPAETRAPLLRVAGQGAAGLEGKLQRAFEDLNARKQGLFHEDVTAIVAPFFPSGQSFDETKKTLREQGLGSLDKFKGVSHDHSAMYVARVRIAGAAYDNVYVVIDFDFGDDMRLRRVKAFLRASNM